jgi:subtilisin family serine protease
MKLNSAVFARVFTFLIMISIITTLGSAQTANQSYQGHDAAANEVLIKFQQPAADDAQGQAKVAADIQQAQVTADVDVVRTVGSAGWMLFHSASNDVTTLMSMLTGAASVANVEPNWAHHVTVVPNDPFFSDQWGLQNTGQVIWGVAGTPGADIRAVPAWNLSTGSPTILVGVVDTGIQYTHPDLAANVWSAPSQFSFLQGSTQYTCPAGTHGWNTFTGACDPMDDNQTYGGHGTQVSGIIGAAGNNNMGVAGVNWTTTIITAKACDSGGNCYVCNEIDALQFMEGVKAFFDGRSGPANIRVLNNSYGGPGGFSQAFLDEIYNANTADMLFVASAGNNGSNNDTTPFYPASYSSSNVVAVAAFDNRDYLASGALNPPDPFSSNYGPNSVHLGGPGVYEYTTHLGGDYDAFNGTSAAAPHVAGTAALSLSVCKGDTQWLVPNILNNVVKTSSLTGKTITGGRVNAYNSVYAASQACPGTGDGLVQGNEQSKMEVIDGK